MQGVKYLLLFLGLQLASATSKSNYFYRKDYTYIQQLNAFYKLHLDETTIDWNYAFLTCEDEGAQLFYPEDDREQSVVKKLMDMSEELNNRTEVLIGVHDKFHIGEFMTVDGYSAPSFINDKVKPDEGNNTCVVFNFTEYKLKSCSELTSVLFVCKRRIEKLCPTIDPDYKYHAQSNKCYKLNKKSANWNEAMKSCYMEGGILAVMDDHLTGFRDVLNIKTDTDYYVGLRDIFENGNYYSVNGIKYDGRIEKYSPMVRQYNGYELPPIPDDISLIEYRQMHELPDDMDISRETTYQNEDTLCGVLAINNPNMIKAASCNGKRPFICEMEL